MLRNRLPRYAAVAAVTALVVVVVRASRRPGAAVPPPPPPPPAAAPPVEDRGRPARRWVAALVVGVLAVVGGTAAFLVVRPDGAACLSDPKMTPDTAGEYVSGMPRPLTIEDLPAPGPVLETGAAMEMGASVESRHTIAVLGVRDLPSSPDAPPIDGRRLVSVVLRENNPGQRAIIPQGDDQAWLCDTDGNWYQHDAAMTRMLAEPKANLLDAGLQVDQKVVFQIRGGARPARVRIIQHDYPADTINDWKLR